MSFLNKIFIFDYFFSSRKVKYIIEFGHQILAPKSGHRYHFWPVFAMIVIFPIYLLYLLIQKVNSESFWISVRLGRTNLYYLNIVLYLNIILYLSSLNERLLQLQEKISVWDTTFIQFQFHLYILQICQIIQLTSSYP